MVAHGPLRKQTEVDHATQGQSEDVEALLEDAIARCNRDLRRGSAARDGHQPGDIRPGAFLNSRQTTQCLQLREQRAGLVRDFGTSTGPVASGVAVPIDFSYEAGAGILPADLTGVQDATISMTSSTRQRAAASAFRDFRR